MGTLDRRDYMKTMIGGSLLVTMRTPVLASMAEEKQGTATSAQSAFWKRVDTAKGRELVESAIKAARAEVEAQRAVNASQRAAILLGAGADAQYHKQATTHYETRTTALRKTKDALSRFVKDAGESGERQFATFVEKGGMKEFAVNARKSIIEALLHSDISPDEARTAVQTLDERLSTIQEKKSFSDLTSYLNQSPGRTVRTEDARTGPKWTLRSDSDHQQLAGCACGDRCLDLHLHTWAGVPGDS